MAMALVFAAGAIVFTDESDAANATVKIDKHVVATEGEVKATIMFQETAAYTSLGVTYDAKVTDGMFGLADIMTLPLATLERFDIDERGNKNARQNHNCECKGADGTHVTLPEGMVPLCEGEV